VKQYHTKVEVVLIIEPDSLPNLATNSGIPGCGNSATTNAYKTGVAYAINKFKDLNVTMYLDAAHGGWLGWEDNTGKFVNLLTSMDFSLSSLRGFSTNVANYQPLGVMCPWSSSTGTRNDYCLNNQHQSDVCCSDPCRLEQQWNPANNEMNYALSLYHNF
jgi:cellulase/cellobiase CelA1